MHDVMHVEVAPAPTAGDHTREPIADHDLATKRRRNAQRRASVRIGGEIADEHRIAQRAVPLRGREGLGRPDRGDRGALTAGAAHHCVERGGWREAARPGPGLYTLIASSWLFRGHPLHGGWILRDALVDVGVTIENEDGRGGGRGDRKSTRLNSSHSQISY